MSIDLLTSLPQGCATSGPLRPSAIVASVFNLGDQLDEFVGAFAPHRDRVWLISDGSTDNTVSRLPQGGWRCFDDGINRRKPAALRVLLEQLPPYIDTVMVVDPDIRLRTPGNGSRVDAWTSPAYFTGTVGSYLALGVIALFTVVPRAERAYIAPIVPLYLLYALTHLLTMTVGFGNFFALQRTGRRPYRDHYGPGAGAAAAPATAALARRA